MSLQGKSALSGNSWLKLYSNIKIQVFIFNI